MDATETQDALRPIRMFVGALQGALAGADQSYAYTDGRVWSTPYQYQTVGPYGVAVEGAAVSVGTRGLYMSPMMLLLGAGVLYFAFKR